MIEFKVSVRNPNDTQSLFHTCKCGATNVRGVIKCVDTRPFICWKCGENLPNIMGMLMHRWIRLRYYTDGVTPTTR